jgi:hypothetical protein
MGLGSARQAIGFVALVSANSMRSIASASRSPRKPECWAWRWGEPHDRVVDFTQQRGLRYTQLVDEHFVFADALGSQRIPTSLVIDRHGNVLYRGGELDPPTLEAFSRAIQVD